MEILVIAIIALLVVIIAAAIWADERSQESFENLEVAVDNLDKEMQNLKRVHETYDREQEHI